MEVRFPPSPSAEASPVRYAKFESIRYFIDIDIYQNLLVDIDIDIFKNGHVDIDINIFQKCRYIDSRYVISIYRTGLWTTVKTCKIAKKRTSTYRNWG